MICTTYGFDNAVGDVVRMPLSLNLLSESLLSDQRPQWPDQVKSISPEGEPCACSKQTLGGNAVLSVLFRFDSLL